MRPARAFAAALFAALAWPAAAQFQSDLPALVARSVPMVVQVSTRTASPPRRTEPLAGLSEWEAMLRQPPVRPRVVGSGIVLGADGYVLTATHIIDRAETITVRLTDGRTLAATLVGADRRSNVALLKVPPAGGLVAATPGDPRRLRLGERVFALGAQPAGNSPSVTDGIVSAMDLEQAQALGYLQTTVTLHDSMGGGPLFNSAGQLVGMNTLLHSRVTGAGLSFAIPIDDALEVVKELRANGRVRRATLGIAVQEVTADTAAMYGMDQPAGALVQTVSPGSPAQQAGILPGDILMRVGGEQVRSALHLPRSLAKFKPGERVTVRVRRMKDVREEDVSATLAEAPD